MKSNRPLLMLLAYVSILSLARTAAADIVLTVESVTAQAGTTGNAFDVLLSNTGNTGSAIDAFSFGLTIASDILMTGATTSTLSADFIFRGHSFFGPDLATLTGPTLIASDLHDEPGIGIILAAGATVALGRVSFDVSSSAGGVYHVSILPFPSTGLTFAEDDVPIQRFQDGRITVPTAAVPEPSSLALGLIGSVSLAVLYRRRVAATGGPPGIDMR